MDWSFFIIVWLVCAGIGAAITNSKDRGAFEGLLLGGLLGILGLVVAACLSRGVPKAPPGMLALQCPRCRALQNVPAGQTSFQCWQCNTTNPLLGFKTSPSEVPSTAAQSAPAATKKCPDCAETILADAKVCKHCGFRFPTGNVKCHKCQHVQEVLRSQASFTCKGCSTKLRRKVTQ
jgi:LSD1 subclass zinc finger protein